MAKKPHPVAATMSGTAPVAAAVEPEWKSMKAAPLLRKVLIDLGDNPPEDKLPAEKVAEYVNKHFPGKWDTTKNFSAVVSQARTANIKAAGGGSDSNAPAAPRANKSGVAKTVAPALPNFEKVAEFVKEIGNGKIDKALAIAEAVAAFGDAERMVEGLKAYADLVDDAGDVATLQKVLARLNALQGATPF